jgi:hypothetical protein
MITTTPLFSTLLSLAAAFLGLSLLVQVFQEVYKYLTSSKARAYENALVDFLGPHALKLKRPGALPDLLTRGPFEFLRRRPTGHLQPMNKDTLVTALERTAAPWIQRALDALHLESDIQKGTPADPSPSFQQFVRELAAVSQGSPGYFTALELAEFLGTWHPGEQPLDAAAMLQALRHRFLPNVVHTEANFPQLEKNVDYAYRRRNLRQTFTFGLLTAIVFQLPVDRLYQHARSVPLDQAITAAERAQALYQAEAARDTSVVRDLSELRHVADSIKVVLRSTGTPLDSVLVPGKILAEFQPLRKGVYYLIGCLLTSLLISFGAPFWNDLTGALLRYAKGPSAPAPPKEE